MITSLLKFFNSLFEKPFKVGIISYYYPFKTVSTSGVGTHAYNLVTHLAKLGCEVHVFTFTPKKNFVERVRVGEGRVILHFIGVDSPFKIEDPVVSKRVKYSIFENKVLEEASLENSRRRFDVIHTHGWLTGSAFMLKYLYRLPWVHTVHALEKNRLSNMTEEEKKLYRLTSWIEDTIVDSDKLIAVSNSTVKELLKVFGQKVAKKIEIIPNGVDLSLFGGEGNRSKTVLTVTRFSKEKGIELLPDIIERVLSSVSDSKFIVVANETNLPTLLPVQEKFIALKEKYKERFEWVSKPLTSLELAPYYKRSLVYLQTSFYETFGLCILESMASGNAVVATKVGGVPEVVGKAGKLVEPDSIKLSNAVIRFLRSSPLRKKYSERALLRAKEFDWRIIAQKVLELYKSVIERKREIEQKVEDSAK